MAEFEAAANLRETMTVGRIALALVASWIFAAIVSYIQRPGVPKNLPILGEGKGWRQRYFGLGDLVQEAYEQYCKNGKAVVVPATIVERAVAILPISQMQWALDQPDTVLSADQEFSVLLNTDINFMMGPDGATDFYHGHVLRVLLPRSLPDLIDPLQDQAQISCDELLGHNKEWHSINIWNTFFQLVAPLNNRVLVGKDLANDKKYTHHMIQNTLCIVRNNLILGLVPSFLIRRTLGNLLALFNKYHFWQTKRRSIPVIKQRLAEMADPDFKPPSEYLSWHIKLAKADGRANELTPDKIARRLVPLNFATIHTTTMTILSAMEWILASDEKWNTIAMLREEATNLLAENNGKWTKATVNRAHRMNSAIRESQRIACLGVTLSNRMVAAKEGLHCPQLNTTFPYGSRITFPAQGAHTDPNIYPNAEEYQPWRFSQDKEDYDSGLFNGVETSENGPDMSKRGLAATSTKHFPFGHGRHACPGRFFVAHELKILLAYIFMNYDFKPLKGIPPTETLGLSKIPHMELNCELRRRA